MSFDCMAPTKLMFCTVLGDSQRWVVAVDWPDGTIEQVGEFQRQSQATDWITNNRKRGCRNGADSGAGAKPSTKPVQAAYAEFVSVLVGHPPRPIPVCADAANLVDRADHRNKVLTALSEYLTATLD